MPIDLFRHALVDESGPPPLYQYGDCVGACLLAGRSPLIDFDFEGDSVTFKVVSTTKDRKVQSPEHLDRTTTVISVSVCNLLHVSVAEQRLALECEAGELSGVDLRGLVQNMFEVVGNTFKWHVAGKGSLARLEDIPTSVLHILNCEDSPAPSIVGGVSEALVPVAPVRYQSTSNVLSLPDEGRAINAALQVVVKHKAFVGSGTVLVSSLGLQADTLRLLQQAGMVSMRMSDVGEQLVAVNPSSVRWVPAVGAAHPMPIHKSRLLSGSLSQQTKLHLLMTLQDDGFTPGMPNADFTPDAPALVRAVMSRPWSYFAALLTREQLFAKGVRSIPHLQVDYLYRCLLILNVTELVNMLDGMEGMGDRWFRKLFKSGAGELVVECEGFGGEDADAGWESGLQLLSGPELQLAPVVCPEAQPIQWKRHIVRTGGSSRELKVYFDNFTGGSGRQRGFCNCQFHSCIRYRPVSGTLEEYMAEFYVWHMVGEDNVEFSEKVAHLKHKPSGADITRVLNALVMVPF